MHRTAVYLIRVLGPLVELDASWFEGLILSHVSPRETLLQTPAIDQTALHGILATLRDLAIPLIAVQQLDPPPDR
jgi:hypothetical protein